MLPAQPSPSRSTGTLFVVSMPIGDPEDITLRALRVLREVGLIVAEDSRVARSLLAAYAIETEIISLRPRRGTPARTAALTHLNAGHKVALVADSGTPTVIDPGLRLVQAALQQRHRVTAVPGATACLAALVLSGLPPTPFHFFGSPPRHEPERTAFFTHLSATPETAILYESPRYLRSALIELSHRLEATRKIVVACDITHSNERVFRGTISEALTEFADNTPIGAYTLVVAGKSSAARSESSPLST